MLLSKLCTLALIANAAAAPVDVVKRGSQLPIAAHSDGQTVLLGETAYYVPSMPEVSFLRNRQIWRLTNTGIFRFLGQYVCCIVWDHHCPNHIVENRVFEALEHCVQ